VAKEKKRKQKGKQPKQSQGKTMAERADRHVLYEKAVQAPDVEVEFLSKTYQQLRGRPALSLKEDFCGTASVAATWCQSDPAREAIGVDICTDTLAWGKLNNVEAAGDDVASRVTLLNADVREVFSPQVDITCAFNFSYCLFETRAELRRYFEGARRGLKPDGLLFLDLFGGTEAYQATTEETRLRGQKATYVWEQASFNPITHHMDCFIHFDFDDGSRLEKAFSYSWRMWILPEIKELLSEAGFSNVHIYWERYEEGDEDDEYMEGTGEYYEVEEVETQESWLSYIVAEV